MVHLLLLLGFLWWWPLGLVFLGFWIARRRWACGGRPMMAGEGQMFDRERSGDRWERKMARLQDKMERVRSRMERVSGGDWFGSASSGNRAFDDYRAETLKRLEDEQREFKDFLAKLRFAKDRAEFDQFMASRRAAEPGPAPEPPHPPQG